MVSRITSAVKIPKPRALSAIADEVTHTRADGIFGNTPLQDLYAERNNHERTVAMRKARTQVSKAKRAVDANSHGEWELENWRKARDQYFKAMQNVDHRHEIVENGSRTMVKCPIFRALESEMGVCCSQANVNRAQMELRAAADNARRWGMGSFVDARNPQCAKDLARKSRAQIALGLSLVDLESSKLSLQKSLELLAQST